MNTPKPTLTRKHFPIQIEHVKSLCKAYPPKRVQFYKSPRLQINISHEFVVSFNQVIALYLDYWI